MGTTTEIAEKVSQQVKGARVVAIEPSAGQMPGFVIVFENEMEQHCSLTIQVGLSVQAQSNQVGITAMIMTNLTPFGN